MNGSGVSDAAVAVAVVAAVVAVVVAAVSCGDANNNNHTCYNNKC